MNARLAAFAAAAAAFTGFFYAGSASDVDAEAASELIREFNELIAGIDALGIFVHNASLALPMFVPGLGLAWGLYAAWATGYAVAAISTSAPALAQIHPLAILYLSPFGLMELAAYSMALSRSALLLGALVRRTPVAPQLKPAAAEAGILAAVLLAAAHVEYVMLDLGSGVPAVPDPLA